MRLRQLALLSVMTLAGSACGKSAPDTPPPADTAPAVDTAKPAPPAAPMAEHAAALSAPLASPEALDAMSQAANALTDWAKAHADAPDASAAALAGARGHLLHAVGGALEHIQARSIAAQGELEALVKAGAKSDAIDPATLAKAAAAVTGLFEGRPFVAPADALDLAAGTGDAAEVVRATWTAAATTALEGLLAAPEAAPSNRFEGGVGRLLCADCAQAGELAPDAVVPFLLDAGHGAGLACKSATDGAADAKTATDRAKLVMGCEKDRVDGAAELATGFGQNVLEVALLARATRLVAMPDGEGPLAPVIKARKEALAKLLAAPYPLSSPALTEALPEEGERSEEATLPAPIDGLVDTGLSVTSPAMAVAVVAPDGVRAGVRPTVGVKGDKIVSLSLAAATSSPDAAVFPSLDGSPVLPLGSVLDMDTDDETGALAPLRTAAALVAQAADGVIPPGDGPRAAELVVDALAPSEAVVRAIDSMRAAGFTAFRFTRTAGSGAVPLVVRAAPEQLPDAAAPGYARPIIVDVHADAVDIWGPDDAADPAPTGDPEAKLPEAAAPGYRGKTLVRVRVAAGDDDVRGLSAETVAKVLDGIRYWREASGAGPLVHVTGDGRAADVLRISDAFQHLEGTALEDAETLWPGATCPSAAAGGAPVHCPTGLAVAFSAIAVPSSRGITDKPVERAPKEVKPAEPPPSPEFCNSRDIKANMARQKHAFRFCYESQLRVISDLSGKLPVTFTIELDGSVKNVRVGAATLKNERVRSCIVKTINRMRFAKPDGGRCLVRWPFVFQPK